jgi:hypothetical protein
MQHIYTEPQAIPDALLNLMPRQGALHSQSNNGVDGVEHVVAGYRNEFLTSLAGTMRRNGLNQTGIEEGLLALNLTMCSPALALDEVLKIANSMARYPVGPVNSGSNLSSALGQPSTGVRLERVNGGQLKRESSGKGQLSIKKLPFLGESEISPFIHGFSHLLSGYPKTGKTELMVRMIEDWRMEGLKVCYVTEEPEIIWQYRLNQLPYTFENLDLMFALGHTSGSLIAAIEAGQQDVVVIDTLKLLQIPQENDQSSVNLSLTPVIAACRRMGNTLILLHHTREAHGEYGSQTAGSYAFLATVDCVIELHRDPAENRRRLKGWGRLVRVPNIVYEMQDDGTMVVLGDPQQVDLQLVRDAVVRFSLDEWTTTKDLKELLPTPRPSDDQILKALNLEAENSTIERDPPWSEGSKPGKTYKWRKGM